MKNHTGLNKFERGQVIPMVVLMLFAIIAMVALIIDGGSLLSNRRTAQAAADAGALAGAKEICSGNAANAIYTANNFVTNNHAVPSGATILTDAQGHARGLTITATTSNGSFFAKIFNRSTLEASADATAGCYAVSAAKVLPIAWACRKPVGQSDSPDCIINMLDWLTEMKPLITGTPNPVNIHKVGNVNTPMDFSKNYVSKYLYVVMDSPKIDEDTLYTCADPTLPISSQPGKIDCDIDNDGVNDVLGHGDRSWLDLDGIINDNAQTDTSNGAKALKNWIQGIGVPTLAVHTWLGGQTGVATSIFKTVDDYAKGKVAIVPVYNYICDTNPENKQACYDGAHLGMNPVPTDNPVKVSPGASYYFHIVGFSAFYITCVDDGGANKCPGAKQLIQDNVDEKIWSKSIKIKSIEGYFIDNYPFDIGNPGTGGVDVGVHIVSLSE